MKLKIIGAPAFTLIRKHEPRVAQQSVLCVGDGHQHTSSPIRSFLVSGDDWHVRGRRGKVKDALYIWATKGIGNLLLNVMMLR